MTKLNHVGVELSKERNSNEETQAVKATAVLRNIIRQNKMMIKKNKMRIYEKRVKPILSYATETKTKTSTMERLTKRI